MKYQLLTLAFAVLSLCFVGFSSRLLLPYYLEVVMNATTVLNNALGRVICP